MAMKKIANLQRSRYMKYGCKKLEETEEKDDDGCDDDAIVVNKEETL